MATADRRAEVTWQGNLVKGSGTFDLASSEAVRDLPVTWASRTERPGKTSPEELIAAAHASCYAMALSGVLAEMGNEPEELNISAVCTFDVDQGKVTTMVLDVRGRVPASTRRVSGAPPNRPSRGVRSPTPCAGT